MTRYFTKDHEWIAIDGDEATVGITDYAQGQLGDITFVELPSEGGHTLFSNMYKAYDAVPDELKRKLKGKRALHIHEYNRNRQASHAGDISLVPHCYHPVFTRHPDTGRKSLFVDRLMTTSIEGFDDEESAAILSRLYDIGERREFIYEHVWRLGDFLMWDNRCTMHRRDPFDASTRRIMHRTQIKGETAPAA